MKVSDEAIHSHWTNYYGGDGRRAIAAALDHPQALLEAQFRAIQRSSLDLAEELLRSPRRALRIAQLALKAIPEAQDLQQPLILTVKDLPHSARTPISSLRAKHLGRFIAVEGLVKKVGPVRPLMLEGAFECKACGNLVTVYQDEEFVEEPVQCDSCEKQTSWRMLEEESRMVDYQPVQLQEPLDAVTGGKQPQRITVALRERLVESVTPGDRVRVNAVLVTENRRQGMKKKTEFERVLEAASVEHQERIYEEQDISDKDVEAIRELAASDPYEVLLANFAPSIHGHINEKKALLLSLFGGVRREKREGGYLRGDIHTLLIGDPGVAKSELAMFLERVAPRCIITTGKGSSTAGLTGAAVQGGQFADGQWTIEAGSLPLADMGCIVVDELEKMSKSDQGAMHPAMEQQIIHMSKAGVTASMKTRCAVIGTANPKLGRYDPYESIQGQINLPPALVSRFDFIFAILDKPDKTRDAAIAGHVMRAMQDDAEDVKLLDQDFYKKYVAYARREIQPKWRPEASRLVQEHYVEMRGGGGEDAIPITARQLHAYRRAAEAVARIRLHEFVEVEDVEEALSVHQACLESTGVDPETGQLDAGVIATGVSHSQHDRIKTVMGIVREKSQKSEKGYTTEEDVLEAAALRGIPKEQCEKALATLRRDNSIYAKGGSGTVAPI